MELAVNELFGPTFQGEGISQGRVANFLRLHGCHLACAWCDTPQTWGRDRHPPHQERRLLDTVEVLSWLARQPADLLVVTGGVEVETSGAIAPTAALVDAVTRFTVSAKLGNAKMPVHRRIRPAALRALAMTGKASWKFVVQPPGDLDEAAELVETYPVGAGVAHAGGRGPGGAAGADAGAGRPGARAGLEPDLPAARPAVGRCPWPLSVVSRAAGRGRARPCAAGSTPPATGAAPTG